MKRSTLLSIIFVPIFIIVFISTVIMYINKNDINIISSAYSNFVTKNFINENKNIIQEEIYIVSESIKYDNSQIESILKDAIKDKLDISLKLAEKLYQVNKDKLSKQEIKKIIIQNLSYLRYSNNEGYYFIIDFSTGTIVSHPRKEFIGKDVEIVTKNDKFLDDVQRGLKNNPSGYIDYEKLIFYKVNDDKKYPKLTGRVWYKPLNLIIGTGEYLDSVEVKVKQQNLDKIKSMNTNNNSHIVVYESKNDTFNIIGHETSKLDQEKIQILSDIKDKGNGFYEYSENNQHKISFFYYLKEWDWVLQNSFYLDNLEQSIEALNQELNMMTKSTLENSVLIIAVIIFITLFILLFILIKIKNTILKYTQKIKEQHQELETIFNTSKDAIAILDMDGNFTYFNKAYKKMTGLDKDTLINQKCTTLTCNEYIPVLEETLEEVMKTGYVENFEKACIVKDNKKIYVNMSIALMPDKKSFLVSARDITKIKKDQKKLKEFIHLIDENIITSTTDLEGNIIYASEAFCKISGYTKMELLGQNHRIVRHEDMPKELYENLWNTLSMDEQWNGEIKNKKKDGGFYWVEATISPIYEEGEKVGYTAIRQDITDKKKIEEISITDGLTSLYNRRHFDEAFPKILNSAKRNNEIVSFLLMDIDHFKQYNDTYGHQKGDEVLIKVSKCLKDSLNRADDMAFRLGGEEFGIVFKTDTKQKALEFSDKLRQNIEDIQIVHEKNSASDYITASMGLVCEHVQELPSVDTIYKNADDLLYKSKENGRNRVSST